jgi:hypothetical protein
MTEPAACVAQLITFARGVEWLLAGWEDLAQELEKKEHWTVVDFYLAMRLMGKCPETFHEGDGEVAAFRTLAVAASPEVDPSEIDFFFGLETSQVAPEERQKRLDAKLLSREEALEGLWAMFDAEFERLAAIREKLWEREDGPALQRKIDLAAFDSSKKGVLRRRYQSANHLDMHRCLKQFAEQRKQHEIRVAEEREIEEKAKAKEAAARQARYHFEAEQRQRARLRNEAKSSATTHSRSSTSGKQAAVDLSDFEDPAKVIERVMGAKAAAEVSAQVASRAKPGAGEAQKPS